MIKILRVYFCFLLLSGVIYPLLVTLFAQTFFKKEAEGSFVYYRNKKIGSALISQKFNASHFFWPRPSAIDYKPLPSGGSNLGPTSLILRSQVDKRRAKFQKEEIPKELLFASGSGLDPHISLKTAYFQIERISEASGISSEKLKMVIDRQVVHSWLSEPYVNVLLLNLLLREMHE